MNSSAGFSLTGVLVAIGMMGIMASVFSAMMIHQGRETYALGQKMKLLDFEMEFKTVMSQEEYCHCLFRGRDLTIEKDKIFIEGGIDQLPEYFESPMPTWPKKCRASETDFVRKGAAVRGSDALAQAIELSDLRFAGGETYRGRLTVQYEVRDGYRAYQPATAAVSIVTTKSESSFGRRQILGCAGSGSGDSFRELEQMFQQRLAQAQKQQNQGASRPDQPSQPNDQLLQQMLQQIQGALKQ